MSEVPAKLEERPESAADSVFQKILEDIVRGVYSPRSRLPAERELARTLGSSRPTLREALSRLSEWNLVEARRGSGVVVRDPSEWTIEVLPGFLRFGGSGLTPEDLSTMIQDLLAIRLSLTLELIRRIKDRVDPGKLAAVREAVRRAWELREDPRAFQAQDFLVVRSLMDTAGFVLGVWLWNRLASVYQDIAYAVSTPVTPPSDYVETYDRFLDALEAGDSERAIDIMSEYLHRYNDRLMTALGIKT
jgi:GntR family transcriptional regulator, transcriptional repressor for pyruvate dehydrogenase complex